MAYPKNLRINFSGSSITKNTIYNLLGYGIPMIIALILIPPLINGLGVERYGVLNLAWVVIGYFSFFDFGIGRSLTKIISEKIGTDQINEIPGLFWTSLFLMFAVSLLFLVLLFIFFPFAVTIFKVSDDLRPEVIRTFYILILSIPIVSTTAGLRGVLEAYQKFGVINIMRIFLGIFTFLVPLVCLIYTQSLFWIVLFLILIRIIMWFLYLKQCFNINPSIKSNIKVEVEINKACIQI